MQSPRLFQKSSLLFRESSLVFAKSPLVFLIGRKGPLRAASERRRRWGSVRARLGRVVGSVRGSGWSAGGRVAVHRRFELSAWVFAVKGRQRWVAPRHPVRKRALLLRRASGRRRSVGGSERAPRTEWRSIAHRVCAAREVAVFAAQLFADSVCYITQNF